MKKTNIKRWSAAVLAGASLMVCPTGTFAAGDLILNTFDSAAELSATDNDWSGASATWDGTVDAGGGGGTGSLKITGAYSNPDPTSWQETQAQRNIPWNGGSYISLPAYDYIEFDLKVDVANSGAASDGTWGILQPIIQQWDWTPMLEVPVEGANWIHVKQPLSGINTLAHLVVSLHRKYGVVMTNNITYWIDNVKLTVPPSPPPTTKIEKPVKPGLNLYTYLQSGADQFQRISVATTSSDYKWYDAAGDATYSVTISDYPTVANFSTHIFLFPTPQTDANRSDVDWHEPTLLRLDIGNNANGSAYSNVRYKTNAPDSNGIYYSDGNLAGAGSATILGTWTLKISQNTNVTVISPDNTSNTVVLPPDVAAQFNAPIAMNIGVVPGSFANATNGSPAVLSGAQITGTPSTLNTSFTGGTLDPAWAVKAAVPGFVIPAAADAKLWLRWTQPDNGFFPQTAGNIVGTWNDLSGTPVSFGGEFKRVLVSQSQLASPNNNFFRLIKRPFSKLQVIMPGETAAPGTPTGKTGTPTDQTAGVPFSVTVNAVDAVWRRVTTVTDTVNISSSDGTATLPADTALSAGTGSFIVMFGTGGTTNTITATDVTDGTKTPNTGSPTVAQ